MSSFSSHRIDGKVAIITGSSSGIGEFTAKLLIKKGASVTLCGRNQSRLESVKRQCEEISGHSGRVIVVRGDQNDPDVRSKTVQDTVETFGKIDILVANAGEGNAPAQFIDVTEEQFNNSSSILVKAMLFLIQEAAPHLENSKGCIAVVSSICGSYTGLNAFPYSMMKASVNQLVKVLAIALGPKGIRVNGTAPGFVRTNVFQFYGDQADALWDAVEENLAPLHPLESRFSTIDEQVNVLGFLVSEASAYIHGAMINVDGFYSKVCPGFNDNSLLATESW